MTGYLKKRSDRMTIDQYKSKCRELVFEKLVLFYKKIENQEDLSENDLFLLFLMNIQYFENIFNFDYFDKDDWLSREEEL